MRTIFTLRRAALNAVIALSVLVCGSGASYGASAMNAHRVAYPPDDYATTGATLLDAIMELLSRAEGVPTPFDAMRIFDVSFNASKSDRNQTRYVYVNPKYSDFSMEFTSPTSTSALEEAYDRQRTSAHFFLGCANGPPCSSEFKQSCFPYAEFKRRVEAAGWRRTIGTPLPIVSDVFENKHGISAEIIRSGPLDDRACIYRINIRNTIIR